VKIILEIYKNHKRLLLLISIIIVTGSFLLFSNFGILKRYELQKEKLELVNKINLEKHKKDSLTRYISNMENNKLEIERIARECYGMIKPGEKVYFIKKEKK